MEIITHAEAKARGHARFFTGKPCSRGHIAPRYVKSRNCCTCAAAASSAAHATKVRREYGMPYWHQVRVPDAAAAAKLDALAAELLAEAEAQRVMDPYAPARALLKMPPPPRTSMLEVVKTMGLPIPPEYQE